MTAPPASLLGAVPPRARVIIDNDFSGDPDDLWQLAHHVLSPSVEIRFVIGSHLAPGDPFDPSEKQASNAVVIAQDLLARLGRSDLAVVLGAERGLPNTATPILSAAARAIIDEARRTDVDTPLYYCAGGGLTDLASALIIAPDIAERLTLVWIGGSEYPHLAAPPPGALAIEYNLNIDVAAAQFIFGESDITIWQVPRDTYRQALFSHAEIEVRIRPLGELGEYLAERIQQLVVGISSYGINPGETYVMGDNPLVLLTALQSGFEADASSSSWVAVPRHRISDTGEYGAERPTQRPVRVYTRIDTRLMFDDLVAKLTLHAQRDSTAPDGHYERPTPGSGLPRSAH